MKLEALAVAQTQVGKQEQPKGSNSGPEVNAYLKSVGLGPGFAWCMAFVYWCVAQACAKANLTNPLFKTGACILQLRNTKCKVLPANSPDVKAGDVFIMQFEHGTGHTGFVERILGDVVYTIEGNTNDDGSREGYEVARRSRKRSSITAFIQLP